jgi:enoyl-CoA hydratase
MTLTTLKLSRSGAVGTVTLARPEVRNAINLKMVEELTGLLDELALDETLRALVFTGDGEKSFAAGADIEELRARGAPEALQAINGRLFQKVEDFPRPTLAAIRGFALGGGLELALACDLRIAGRSARMGLPEVSLGIYPAAGGTSRLPRLVGLGRAKELIFTGRLISADEALGLRIVEQVVEDSAVLATAQAVAETIAQHAPLAVRVAKLSLNAAARGADTATVERLGQAVLFESKDKMERMTAFLEKRSKKG